MDSSKHTCRIDAGFSRWELATCEEFIGQHLQSFCWLHVGSYGHNVGRVARNAIVAIVDHSQVYLVAHADLLLVGLMDEPRFSFTILEKPQSYSQHVR